MKNSKKKVILTIAAAAFAAVALLCMTAGFVSERNRSEALSAELAESSMELKIRNFAAASRDELAENEEQRLEEELEQRRELTKSMKIADRNALLALVNPWNILQDSFVPRVVEVGDSKQIDERAYSALRNMLDDCRAAGNRPVLMSAFRTQEYQQQLFDNKVQRLIWDGVSPDYAPAEAAREVAVPGTSEHQLGLAVDIVDNGNPELDFTQEWTPTTRWLMEHCVEYGFILRYPNGTTETTGIVYEPWHYRYIGKEAARLYTESGCATFEEFLEGYRN